MTFRVPDKKVPENKSMLCRSEWCRGTTAAEVYTCRGLHLCWVKRLTPLLGKLLQLSGMANKPIGQSGGLPGLTNPIFKLTNPV